MNKVTNKDMDKLRFLGVFVMLMFTLSAFADNYDFVDNGIYYKIETSNTVTVTSGNSNYSIIVIPEKVIYDEKEYSVTSVGNKAFYGFSSLSNVTLPATLKSIGDYAFYNTSISAITIPNSVETIGERSFALCPKLGVGGTDFVKLSSSLKSIGRSAFSSSGIRGIVIPASVTAIGPSAFASCEKLSTIQVESGSDMYESPDNCNAIIEKNTKTLIVGGSETVIPKGIINIGENAFYGSGLKSIEIPETVESIGDWGFYNCKNLNSVSMSSSLIAIGERAFALCPELKEIDLLKSPLLQTIGRSAFSSSGLEGISIPKSVVFIGQSAFSNCENLVSMQVQSGNEFYSSPNNCNAVLQGSVLVAGCTGTKNLSDNLDIKAIGENAFYGSGLTQIVLPNTVTTLEGWAFYNCAQLKSITLPEKLNYIEERAFALCTSLTEIVLPASIKDIERYAFSSCSNLRKVVSRIQVPFAIKENVFTDETYSGLLEVPLGTKEAYKQTDYWSKFANNGQITEFDPSGIASPTITLQRIYSDNGVVYIESAAAGSCNIYSMSGLLVRTVALKAGTNSVGGLTKGVYVVNGVKVLIR